MARTKTTFAGLGLLLIALAAGCGDEKTVAVGGGPGLDAMVDGSAPDDVGAANDAPTGLPEAGPNTDVPTTPGDRQLEIVLLHDTTSPIQIPIQDNFLIRAKVIDYGSSGPAANVLVSYEIIEGGGDASLTTSQAFTDSDGTVGVTFRANSSPDVSYRVRLMADGAEPVFINLIVTDTPKGDIIVDLLYEGPINVKNVRVRLIQGWYTCGQFKATNTPTDVISEKTLLGLGANQSVEFTQLPESQKFTAFATAESPDGQLAAAGCIDGIVVLPGQDNKVTLTMFLLTLNPAGQYDTTNIFDFTGAIPGDLGTLVDEIVTLFNNPGKFLLDRVKEIVAAYIGQLVTDIAFSLFEDALADVITNWLLNESPDWIQDIFTIGQDLTQVVNNLEMEADLIISKLSNDYYVQGVLYWDGIVLYWHYGCAKPGEAGYDPDCGKLTFSLDSFTNTQFPMDIIEGKFTGLIHDFDRLDIDNHVIKINYGKLILFVLNEIILPALTGEHNLTDAILSFINCPGIAAGISNGILDGIGIDEQDLTEFCEDGITFITQPVTLIIGGLALDSQLRLSGRAKMLDDDNDLRVDHILDGVYLGTIEVDGQAGPTFDGTWEAHRK